MNDFQLAWKNLWRNKRRTIITAASVFFAVFFALIMRSIQLGSYDRMFKNIIESYSGYLQLQHQDYFDDPVLDNSFEMDQEHIETIKKNENVEKIVPRLESFALAAAGSRTQGVIVMGIDPENEVSDIKNRMVKFRFTEEAVNRMENEALPDRIKKLLEIFRDESYSGTGRLMLDLGISVKDSSAILPVLRKYSSFSNGYFTEKDTGKVVIGNGLSEYLRINIGDTVVLIGQGYHGVSAAGKYMVSGIVKLPAPDIDNSIVYLPINSARQLYGAEGISTSAVITLKKNDEKSVMEIYSGLRQIIPEPLTVRNWRELNALLINQLDADNKSGMIMIGILYLVIAFGVFGTVLMMLAERRREFGMLVSVGMQKHKLSKVIALELLMTGLLGVISGVIVSLPVVLYFNVHPLRFTGQMAHMWEDYGFEPVMPTLLPDSYYLWQTVVVLIILTIAVLFSIRKIFRINVISSLKA
ncbi:MAG: FtsX-like permease family protein [Bacteroidales bacterium]|jgi:ABC-type lipoprotein release transport system permease subunit|nr:FtsX-like permease family protein [Bacteroidales bacterium]NMD03485.1 ABC transporter permease [Bacteroidales bacterium]OQB64569.1 MAG: ABC transporter permease YtrF precursor [Bacteroidetes bacterium ADurb.Bin145]